jgi:hypothetical protein
MEIGKDAQITLAKPPGAGAKIIRDLKFLTVVQSHVKNLHRNDKCDESLRQTNPV